MDMLRKFYEEEEGLGTVEMVMLIAALMCVALIFKDTIITYVNKILEIIFSVEPETPTGGSAI